MKNILKILIILLVAISTQPLIGFSSEEQMYVKPGGGNSSETFNPPVFGSVQKNIEIQLPPGRNGLTPSLALTYSSSGGNSALGRGWNIGLGAIQRATKNGVDFSGTDFIANGKELAPSSVDLGANCYGEKIEGSFTRYKFVSNSWVATATGGTKYYYGSASGINSRQEWASDTFRWYLDKVEDINGNTIKIDYLAHEGQVYIDKIYYTDLVAATDGYVNTVEFNYVKEPDAGARTDILPIYLGGHKIVTAYKLNDIKVTGNGTFASKYIFGYKASTATGRLLLEKVKRFKADSTAQTDIVTEISLQWQDELESWELAEIGGESGLPYFGKLDWDSSAKYPLFSCDRNGDGKADIGRTNNSSTSFMTLGNENTWGLASLSAPIAFNPPIQTPEFLEFTWSQSHRPVFTGDFDGNGTIDIGRITETGVEIYNQYGTDIGTSTLPVGYDTYISGYKYPVITGDFNGDGKTDLARVSDTGINVFISGGTANSLTAGGTINDLGRGVCSTAVSYPVVTGDFNGDGRTDIGRVTNSGVTIYLADDSLSWSDSVTLGDFGYNVSTSSILYPMIIGDINGDGLTDLGRVNNTGISFYLSDGNGGWDSSIDAIDDLGKTTYTSSSDYPVITGDFNGDGRLDVGRITGSGVTLYTLMNTTWQYINGNAITIPDLGKGQFNSGPGGTTGYYYGNSEANPYSVADFNGDGVTDICRIQEYGVRIYLSSYTKDGQSYDSRKTDLLSNIEYKHGGSTDTAFHSKVTYTYDQYKDLKTSTLPSGMTVIDTVTVDNGFGETYTTSYKYSNGIYDRPEKDFRGFAHVEVMKPDGSKSITTSHTGKYLKGRPDFVEIKDASLRTVRTVDYAWVTEDLDIADSDSSEFVRLEMMKQSDGTNNTLTKAYSYDSYLTSGIPGFPKTMTVSGTDVSGHTGTYNYQSYGDYIWRKKDETLTGVLNDTAVNTEVVRKVEYEYYTSDTTDSESGNISKIGNLFSVTSFNNDGDSPVIEKKYNAYGNPVAESDGYSRFTVTDFNATFCYPVTVDLPVTKDLNDVVTSTHLNTNAFSNYDYRFGSAGTMKDLNGNVTEADFDTFGRVVKTFPPDGSLQTTTYNDKDYPRSIEKTVEDNSAQGVNFGYSIDYLDGYGKTIQSVTKGKTNIGNSVVHEYIITLFTHDNMGRLKYTLGPFSSDSSAFQSGIYSTLTTGSADAIDALLGGYLWSMNHYDALGRVTWVEQSGGINTHYQYSGFTTVTTDPDGYKKTEIKNGLGQLVQITEHGAYTDDNENEQDQTTDYIYNAAGDLLAVERPNPENDQTIQNRIYYNTLGQKTKMLDPDLGSWKYLYDRNGNVTRSALFEAGPPEADVEWTINQYDELNRILKVTYGHVSVNTEFNAQFALDNPQIVYKYDTLTDTMNGDGKLHEYERAGTIYRVNEYDSMGRVFSETKIINGVSATMTYDYDKAGRLEGIVYPGGYEIVYDYHPGTALIHSVTSTGDATPLAIFDNYSKTAKVKSLTYQNSVNTQYLYYPGDDRLQDLTTTGLGSTKLMDFTYGYSFAGDVENIEDKVRGNNRAFFYDKMHRLIEEAESSDSGALPSNKHNTDLAYDYDNQNTHAVRFLTYNGNAAIPSYQYDDKGNMTSGPDFSLPDTVRIRNIRYNVDNMPVAITMDDNDIPTATYVYGVGEDRVSRTENGETTLYFSDN